MRLTLFLLADEFGVSRLAPQTPIPAWAWEGSWVSITRTPSELSLVCPASRIPPEVQAERGWRCFQVLGPLAFEQVGVLASVASPLADAGVSLFVVSTYDTDYIFVKARDLPAARAALRNAGHRIQEKP